MSTTTSITDGRYSNPAGEITVTTLGSRTTVGNTNGIRTNAHRATLQVQVASIGTNVVVSLMASLDGTNYFSIGANQTITANGYTGYTYTDLSVPFLAARLVSISTGTPTVTFRISYN